MAGIWNKFLVFRRDGSVPEWPYLVLGARDPAAIIAVAALASASETAGMDPEYVAGLRDLARRMNAYRAVHGHSDPDAPAHRPDDPEILDLWESRRGQFSGTVPGEK